MTRLVVIIAAIAILAASGFPADERPSKNPKTTAKAANDKAQEFFEMRVRPVLAKNCFACHTASKMGGLEMRSRESLLKGGKSGPAGTAGNPNHGLLTQATRQQGELKMPPQGRLKDEEIEQITAWVKSGAV